MGILIALDGVDASGKETQARLLCERLRRQGKKIRHLSFPAYDSPSSALVKMYLGGEFGSRPEDVNAYAASSFFAADRFATFRTDWEKDYRGGTIILADRYVSSNMIHQSVKLANAEQKDAFLSWLYRLEYMIYELPEPDITLFLDMPPEYAEGLMSKRADKQGIKKDIHESSSEYLQRSYENAVYIARRFGWARIPCADMDGIRSIDEINDDIYQRVINLWER